MRVRLKEGVRVREDTFGGICYVPHRDDFFAAVEDVFKVLKGLRPDWSVADPAFEPTYTALAKLGICETSDPLIREEAYSGPAFLGEFLEIPTVSEPLVLNCFCTAHCPLKCIYCHADDLMQQFRPEETLDQLDNVISTARTINSLVVVITGGDPLTRPERATRLIDGLAGGRALVLDTSGVGDLEALLPTLKKHCVHVRVSLDAISPTNSKLRPINKDYEPNRQFSGDYAQETIRRCVSEGLSTTVQTVISAFNENITELRDLRDWLISAGVRHWVLHITVKGGSARRIENRVAKQKRGRHVLPSEKAYEMLQSLIRETKERELPLDIRCTDTDTTPNSVLLVASNGSLYTEGYAHHGKVLLYDSSEGRPDTLRKLWHYVDRFGHARRYLNWNPKFNGSVSLDKACYSVPLPPKPPRATENIVESEAKYRISDYASLDRKLQSLGFFPSPTILQRDEYYDTNDKTLESLDYVVRLRRTGAEVVCAIKGPRVWTPRQEYSRIELEFSVLSNESVKAELRKRDLHVTWFFEKRRTSYRNPTSGVSVELDEVPQIGTFIEIEGVLQDSREIASKLGPALGHQERKNYREIFVEFMKAQGVDESEIMGASFETQ